MFTFVTLTQTVKDVIAVKRPVDPKGQKAEVRPDNRAKLVKFDWSKISKKKKEMKARKYNEGGSLKQVPKDKEGLAKLPEDVRNKMGYMKKGGKVAVRK